MFDPKCRFCKGYSLSLCTLFANFQNGVIFRILGVFWNPFLHGTTAMSCENVFSRSFLFLISELNWRFSKGSSLFLVAIFANFQNGLIVGIVVVLPNRFFCIEQLQCFVEMSLACFLHFKFLTQSDDFAKAVAFAWWQFLPMFQMVAFFELSHFSSCFFEPFFA